jgi:hypothetical protein
MAEPKLDADRAVTDAIRKSKEMPLPRLKIEANAFAVTLEIVIDKQDEDRAADWCANLGAPLRELVFKFRKEHKQLTCPVEGYITAFREIYTLRRTACELNDKDNTPTIALDAWKLLTGALMSRVSEWWMTYTPGKLKT